MAKRTEIQSNYARTEIVRVTVPTANPILWVGALTPMAIFIANVVTYKLKNTDSALGQMLLSFYLPSAVIGLLLILSQIKLVQTRGLAFAIGALIVPLVIILLLFGPRSPA